ncbi:MAG: radical SAM protein, partial [Bacteroidota bacterium]
MTDILLTHSYFLRLDPKEYRAMMPYPPLGTLYAASLLRQKGYSVAIFDSMLAENESEIQAALESYKPRMVVIYDDDFNYLTKMCLSRMRNAAFGLARFAKQTGAVVAVHGSDASDHLDAYVEHCADFVLCGEAELTL